MKCCQTDYKSRTWAAAECLFPNTLGTDVCFTTFLAAFLGTITSGMLGIGIAAMGGWAGNCKRCTQCSCLHKKGNAWWEIRVRMLDQNVEFIAPVAAFWFSLIMLVLLNGSGDLFVLLNHVVSSLCIHANLYQTDRFCIGLTYLSTQDRRRVCDHSCQSIIA